MLFWGARQTGAVHVSASDHAGMGRVGNSLEKQPGWATAGGVGASLLSEHSSPVPSSLLSPEALARRQTINTSPKPLFHASAKLPRN